MLFFNLLAAAHSVISRGPLSITSSCMIKHGSHCHLKLLTADVGVLVLSALTLQFAQWIVWIV